MFITISFNNNKKGTKIMKKIYNSPKVLVVLIDTQEMICGSETFDPSKSVTDINDLQSRRDNRGSFWDDEEE